MTSRNKLQASILRGSINALNSAIVLLDQNRKVIFLNTAAGRLIERCSELYIRRGKFCAADDVDALRLERLIERVTRGDGRRPAGGAVAIPRGRGKQPLQVLGVPVRVERVRATTQIGSIAILVICDPNRRTSIPQEIISTMFSLTPSETRLLLALINGESLKQYCVVSRVTRNTVRTHLKAVFKKTKTSRQSDLVRLISGLMHSVTFSVVPIPCNLIEWTF